RAAGARNEADLLPALLVGFAGAAQPGGHEQACSEGRDAAGRRRVDQEVAPRLLVLVARQLRTPQALRGVRLPRRQRRTATRPVLLTQAQHPLGDFGRHGVGGVLTLPAAGPLVAVERDSLLKEGLAHTVVGGVVAVLGREGRAVNGRKTGSGV